MLDKPLNRPGGGWLMSKKRTKICNCRHALGWMVGFAFVYKRVEGGRKQVLVRTDALDNGAKEDRKICSLSSLGTDR